MTTGDLTARPLPHHDGSALHVHPVAPRLGEPVRLTVRVHAASPARSVAVRAVLDGEPHLLPALRTGISGGDEWWAVTLAVTNPLVHYRWLVVRDDEPLWVTAAGAGREEPRDADDFVLAADTDVPGWAAGAVLYQVFPDRFARSAAADDRETPDWAVPAAWTDAVVHRGPATSRQLYGGDLDGITAHLDHLQRLGVTVLYLTPIFPARSNHRYDATSFDRVDPILGGDEALVRLVEAAHARGLRVLGDLTTNHCGDGHEWFRAAHRHPEAPESDFFTWLDGGHEDYVSWLGHRSLPKLDWRSRALRERFIDGPDSVVGRWLQPPFSLDGWRIDVANMTGRHAEVDLNAEVRRTVRATMRQVDGDTLLLAEHTADAAPDLPGDAWHGAMTYPGFTRPVWGWLMTRDKPVYAPGVDPMPFPVLDAAELMRANRRFSTGYPWPMRLANLNALDSHDTPRFAGSAPPAALPVGFGLSVGLPGIPFIWAGDELGLPGEDGEQSRTPMPWTTMDEHAPLIEEYAALNRLRVARPALTGGGLRWLYAGGDALAFVRESTEERILVVATRAAATLSFALSGADQAERLHGDLDLEPRGGRVVVSTSGAAIAFWSLPGLTPPDA